MPLKPLPVFQQPQELRDEWKADYTGFSLSPVSTPSAMGPRVPLLKDGLH